MADNPFQISVKEYKGAFFNRHAIESQVSFYKDAEMSKLGALTRLKMKSLLRYNAKASKSPNPPRVLRLNKFKRTTVNRKTGQSTTRATSPLKELIFYARDQARLHRGRAAKFGTSRASCRRPWRRAGRPRSSRRCRG